ncbi:SDR family oxidoreductase [Agromyces ramosus]|uniref:Nucleoside-diphosphate-sugar epimerase n=1 Tax=Agromyces ramosus TaxID=33879 RepID=A0ABU0R676_9MICO|nr:aldehyde reductase [Agromyces ramosus]MDQ0893582.1 nucleoside-diphosphate-sugar epimerase [Agromyces ramosus]
MSGELVVVTGGTGFVGAHCIVRLLEAGHRVRTTVRSMARADEVLQLVRAGGPRAAASADGVEVIAADLLHDDGWPEAVAGASYVLHVASPFPMRQPADENELIAPARDGVLRVLRAARDAGVRRVVQTSSFAAVGYGHAADPGRPYTEEDWTDPDGRNVTPYVKSKTIAELAAWGFIDREGGDLELAVVNPVGIFGPALGQQLSTSVELLLGLLNGRAPAVPPGTTTGVDVRDVADLHLRAMTHPDAAGERFLAVAGDPITFHELAILLREQLGRDAKHVPTRVLPRWLVRVGALVNPELRAVLPQLRRSQGASHEKATRVLGWQPRSTDDAIVASAESLVRLGRVKP